MLPRLNTFPFLSSSPWSGSPGIHPSQVELLFGGVKLTAGVRGVYLQITEKATGQGCPMARV